MDPGGGQGIQGGGADPAVPSGNTKTTRNVKGREGAGGPLGDGAASERSSGRGETKPRGVPEQAIHHSQEGWIVQTSGEPPPTQEISGQEEFQNGECSNAKGSPQVSAPLFFWALQGDKNTALRQTES